MATVTKYSEVLFTTLPSVHKEKLQKEKEEECKLRQAKWSSQIISRTSPKAYTICYFCKLTMASDCPSSTLFTNAVNKDPELLTQLASFVLLPMNQFSLNKWQHG